MKEQKLTGQFRVENEHLAVEIGSGNLPVLGTPALIGFMENIASDLAQKDMTPDMTSVGIHIDMKHTAPSLLGDVIRIVAVIQEKNGREINFFIQAFNEKNEILGEATHKRAVLNRKKFEEKIGLRLPK